MIHQIVSHFSCLTIHFRLAEDNESLSKRFFLIQLQYFFFLYQNLSNFSGGTFWNSNLIFKVNINFFHSVIRGRLYYEMEQGSPVWIVALQFTRVQIMLNNFQMISKVIRMRYHYFSIYITFNAIINFHLLNIDFKTRVNTKYFILVYITLTCINLQHANSFTFLLYFSLNKNLKKKSPKQFFICKVQLWENFCWF